MPAAPVEDEEVPLNLGDAGALVDLSGAAMVASPAARGVGQPLQVAVLKVPVSYAQGVATMVDLKRDMAIMVTSGRHSVKRLACACVSGLGIFS